VGLFAGKHGERTARTEKNGKARQSAVQKWTAESRRRAKMDGGVTPPCKHGTAESLHPNLLRTVK